jgi:hypothetical protein
MTTVETRCIVEIAMTAETFHAYAAPEDVEVEPGDVMLIHDAPTQVAYGAVLTRDCRATVRRAGLLRRAWTRASSLFSLTELYEVGFEAENAR